MNCNSVSLLENPVDEALVVEFASIVFFNTLIEPLLLRKVINFKSLSKLRVSSGVNLSNQYLLSHIFQNLSCFFIFRVRLMCVEVNQYEVMSLDCLIKVFGV